MSTRERLGVGAVRHQLVLQRLARALVCAHAARVTMERASEEDSAVASHAARILAAEAEGWLARLAQADADEEAAREVTDCIYAR